MSQLPQYGLGMAFAREMTLRISTKSGSVRVTAEQRDDILVSGTEVEHSETDSAETWTVAARSESVEALVPEGTTVLIGTKSGSARIKGNVGRTVVTTDSGRVEIDSASEADVRVISGSVRIGTCDGACCVRCGSGSVRIESAGNVDVHAKTGRVIIGEARGDATIRTNSGRVEIGFDGAHDADIASISGRVNVTVPPDVGVRLDLDTNSGHVITDVEEGDDSSIRIRTSTGRVTVDHR